MSFSLRNTLLLGMAVHMCKTGPGRIKWKNREPKLAWATKQDPVSKAKCQRCSPVVESPVRTMSGD